MVSPLVSEVVVSVVGTARPVAVRPIPSEVDPLRWTPESPEKPGRFRILRRETVQTGTATTQTAWPGSPGPQIGF